jgi:multiple sugar transport system permease protein
MSSKVAAGEVGARAYAAPWKVGRIAELVGRAVLYAIIAVLFLLPFLWLVFGAFRPEVEIHQFMFPFTWHTFVPVRWTLQNYLDIFGLSSDGRMAGLQFQLALFNSALVSASVVCCTLVFSTMAAYFFARLPFPGKRFLFAYVIATFLLPQEITIVPLYLVVSELGLRDTYWAMIVPFYASPFIVFMLIQFFQAIPKELDEAALVDGANYWTILWSIIFPSALPGLATAALLEFQFIWNLFYWPLVAVGKPSLQVIQVAIATQTTDRTVYWGRTFAGMVVAIVPVLILFLAAQRFYFRGAVLSGMK